MQLTQRNDRMIILIDNDTLLASTATGTIGKIAA